MKLKYLFLSLIIMALSCGKEESKLPEEQALSKSEIVNTVDISSYKKDLKIETYAVVNDVAKYELNFPGTVYPAPDNIYIVSAPVSGRIIKIFKNEGDNVSKGEVLLEIESLEFANMISDYIKWQADMLYRKNIVEKLTNLSSKKIVPENEFELAKAELRTSQANLQSSCSRLMAVGLTKDEIDNFDKKGRSEPILKIKSAIAGKINEHLIDLGKSVNMYDKMLTVINTDKVMIKGFLPGDDVPQISQGSAVKIITNNDFSNAISSTIKSINPALDEQTKAVTVNILINTVNSKPLPGQLVRIIVDASTPNKVLHIPTGCIMLEGQKSIVFVKISDSIYEKRYVETTKLNDNISIVNSGLKEGELIAITELFPLKALFKISEFAD